jgi:post-segregation antitoxin (ccd killing protein)
MYIWSIIMKKNTLLYLDDELVKTAKLQNINISRVTENALKQILEFSKPQTTEEHLAKLFSEAGKEDSPYGETHLLPFQIKSIKLTDIGPFKTFETEFSENSVNVISGANESGKSVLIRSILYAFGSNHRYFTGETVGEGEIELVLYPGQGLVKISGDQPSRGYQCIVIDDTFLRLSVEVITPLMGELEKLGIQIILTTTNANSLSNYPSANIFRLNEQ